MAAFETELEALRQALHIPGLAAAVVQDQTLLWARGFGYADVEQQIPATADTPFHLASVTKPIAATLIMQLVEEGRLDQDDPISDYSINLPSEGVIRVRHPLTPRKAFPARNTATTAIATACWKRSSPQPTAGPYPWT